MKNGCMVILAVVMVSMLVTTTCSAAINASPAETRSGYGKYYYIFVHGNNAELYELGAQTSDLHNGDGHYVTLPLGGTGYFECPLVGFASINGIHPMIRYMTFTLRSDVSGSTSPTVTGVSIFNGPYPVTTSIVSWNTTGNFADFTYDMGAYHDFYRGLNAGLSVRNPVTGPGAQVMVLGAYGAKMEYN